MFFQEDMEGENIPRRTVCNSVCVRGLTCRLTLPFSIRGFDRNSKIVNNVNKKKTNLYNLHTLGADKEKPEVDGQDHSPSEASFSLRQGVILIQSNESIGLYSSELETIILFHLEQSLFCKKNRHSRKKEKKKKKKQFYRVSSQFETIFFSTAVIIHYDKKCLQEKKRHTLFSLISLL